jgi:hypothetical protein
MDADAAAVDDAPARPRLPSLALANERLLVLTTSRSDGTLRRMIENDIVGMLIVIALSLLLSASAVTIKQWTNFTVPNAAFVQVVQNDLFVTAFGVSISGSISRVSNIGSQLQSGQPVQYTTPVNNLVWPNEMTPLPNNLSAFVVGDGFLPPGKSTGSLTMIG